MQLAYNVVISIHKECKKSYLLLSHCSFGITGESLFSKTNVILGHDSLFVSTWGNIAMTVRATMPRNRYRLVIYVE